MDKNLKALLRYAATAPTADQLEKIRKILADKLDAPDIEIEYEYNKEGKDNQKEKAIEVISK